jgi:hypothetical protein
MSMNTHETEFAYPGCSDRCVLKHLSKLFVCSRTRWVAVSQWEMNPAPSRGGGVAVTTSAGPSIRRDLFDDCLGRITGGAARAVRRRSERTAALVRAAGGDALP